MVRNNEKFEQAVALRKRGFTLVEIAKFCDISKATASKWLKNNAISVEITKQNKRRAGQENAKRLRLINKARQSERGLRQRELVKGAETEFKHYRKDPLFMAGIAIYMAAGDRSNRRQIRLASSRQDSHRLFLRFVEEYLGVERGKIRFWLLLYSYNNEESCIKKWKQQIRLPYTQFHKSQVINTSSQKKPLHYGVGNTIIGSTVLKQKLTCWIDLAAKELAK